MEKRHYVYMLSDKRKEKYYIGARSCSCNIGSDKYMGSSKVMTKEDKDNCNKIILGRFNTREEAIWYEIELHNKFNVSTNDLFWNKAKQTSIGFDTTGIPVNKGRVFTEEHKEKLRQRKLGRKIPREVVEKSRIGLTGKKRSPEQIETIKNSANKRKRTQCKEVVCVDTGEVFFSTAEAARKTGITKGNIQQCCRGNSKTAKGLRFEYR